MSNDARMDNPNGTKVSAKNLISKDHTFYCSNEGCTAEMIIVSFGNPNAHFRSKARADHAHSYCFRDDLYYNPDKYSEKLFDINDFETRICSKPNRSAPAKKASITIGSNKHIAISTLKTLYAAFLSKGIDGTYNGYCINDFLCSVDNYNRYKTGFTGFKIVEATFYHKVSSEEAFILNYPCFRKNNSSHIKVIFEDSKDFWKMYNHFRNLPKDSYWKKPLVIAGTWRKSSDSSCIAECTIINSHQHVYI